MREAMGNNDQFGWAGPTYRFKPPVTMRDAVLRGSFRCTPALIAKEDLEDSSVKAFLGLEPYHAPTILLNSIFAGRQDADHRTFTCLYRHKLLFFICQHADILRVLGEVRRLSVVSYVVRGSSLEGRIAVLYLLWHRISLSFSPRRVRAAQVFNITLDFLLVTGS